MATKQKFLGSVRIGGRAYVSDPCYRVGTWCQEVVDNMVSGDYDAYVGVASSDRIAYLELIGPDAGELMSKPTQIAEIGVDSGLAGVFDAEYFERNADGNYDGGWYGRVCNTVDEYSDGGCIIDARGACSHAGYGDGSYPVYADTNGRGEVNHLMILFIADDG